MKRSTVFAFVILAALAAYIYWFEREPVEETEGELVFGVHEDSVQRIEIRASGADEEPVIVEKEGEDWRLLSPVTAEADPKEIDLLTQNLATMRFERAVARASSVKLSDFGLDTPKIEVRFRTKDGAERSLAFGADTLTSSNQYARRDGGEDVLVLASHLALNFDKSGWDLREKRIFSDPGSTEPRRIEIQRPSGNVVLAREKGLWYVAEPRSRADRNRVVAMVGRIRDAEMREISSETEGDLEAYGLKEPERRVRIELESEGAAPIELDVGTAKDADYHARTPSKEQVFVIGGEVVRDLDSPVFDLQLKKLFDYSVREVKRFRIEAAGAEPRELEKHEAKEEKKWRQIRPEPPEDVDATAVEDLLYALNGATAERVVEGTVDDPAYTITVWSGDPEIEEKIMVAPPADIVRVARAGEEVVLELTKEAWTDLEAKLKLSGPSDH